MANFDVIIVGAGLGGLTAGLFAARQSLSTLILEANIPGGHLVAIEKIEDFPGFPEGVAGYDLCPTVQRQAAEHGAEFVRAEAQSLSAEGRQWAVATSEGRYLANAVIVATGSSLRNLGVPGEADLIGRGISHCASCDGPLYQGKPVGVVGGGDSALQEALTIANYAERVLVFHEAGEFSGQAVYRERVLRERKIDIRYRTVVEAILGEQGLSGVGVRNLDTGEAAQIDLAGLFVYVGVAPNTNLLKGIVKLTESGHVPTDGSMKTERDGLYAVGDIRQDSAAQAITAAGDGATAAVAAYRKNKEGIYPNGNTP
jgi:thioredoxin reductase (NADPH)